MSPIENVTHPVRAFANLGFDLKTEIKASLKAENLLMLPRINL